MAIDKAVDSAALDAGMTATANAIRAKSGGSASIAWDAAKGFADAVAAIPTGGGGVTLSPSALYAEIVSSGTQVQGLDTGLDVVPGQVYAGAWLALKGNGGTTAILYIPLNGATSVYENDTVHLNEAGLYSDGNMTQWRIITQMDAESGEILATEDVAEVYYLLV